MSFLGFLSPELSPFGFSLLFLLTFLDIGWFCSILSPCLVIFSCSSLRDFCVSSLRTSTCLAVFSYNFLRDFGASSSRTSTCLAVFSFIFLSELLVPFLKSSTSIMRYDFKSESYFLSVLWLQDWLRWECWVLMMVSGLGFC